VREARNDLFFVSSQEDRGKGQEEYLVTKVLNIFQFEEFLKLNAVVKVRKKRKLLHHYTQHTAHHTTPLNTPPYTTAHYTLTLGVLGSSREFCQACEAQQHRSV